MLNKNEFGDIKVSKNALNDIADIAAKKVSNVYPVRKDGGMASCTYKDDELKMILSIKVKQGIDVTKLSSKLQSKVYEAISEMTGLEPKSVDIDIQGFTDK